VKLDDAVRAIGRVQQGADAGSRGPMAAKEIADTILADVRSFCGGRDYADDVTIVVVKRK